MIYDPKFIWTSESLYVYAPHIPLHHYKKIKLIMLENVRQPKSNYKFFYKLAFFPHQSIPSTDTMCNGSCTMPNLEQQEHGT